MPGTQVFVAAPQRTPLDHLALVANRANTHRSHTITNGEVFLTSYHPQGT